MGAGVVVCCRLQSVSQKTGRPGGVRTLMRVSACRERERERERRGEYVCTTLDVVPVGMLSGSKTRTGPKSCKMWRGECYSYSGECEVVG